MANTSLVFRAPAARCPLPTRSPIAWIKRRARRLARAYDIERHEAVENAFMDWSLFNPTATL